MKKEKRNEERKGRIKEKNQNITVLYWSQYYQEGNLLLLQGRS